MQSIDTPSYEHRNTNQAKILATAAARPPPPHGNVQGDVVGLALPTWLLEPTGLLTLG